VELPRSPMVAIEPTRAPTRPKGGRRTKKASSVRSTAYWFNGILTFALVFMLACAAVLVWFDGQVDRPGPNTETKLVRIKIGVGTRRIAAMLQEQNVIASRHVFLSYLYGRSLWARMHGTPPVVLKAGDYEFKPGDSIRTVLGRIARGKSVLYSVTIPEGLTSHQIIARLKSDPGLTGDITEQPPEGFLKPETYLVPRNTDRKQVIALMREAQRRYLKKAWAARQENLPFRDVSEAVILASIVQRETGSNDDPARIASVFINRLRKGMRLQSDPTILYGKYGSQVRWGTPIYRSDIAAKTSHNTYQITGLPPTPICNPGTIAVNAVLNPSRTQDLYFVADGRGGHIFSRTNRDHQIAVQKWRKIEKEIRKEQAKAKAKDGGGGALPAPTPVKTVTVPGTVISTAPAPSAPTAPPAEVMSSLGFPLPVRKPNR
jgi:peptidoglycan lytic transglycosylase G